MDPTTYDISGPPRKRRRKKIYIGIHPDLASQVKHRLGVYEMKLGNLDYFGAFAYFNLILEMVVKDPKKTLKIDEDQYEKFKYWYNGSRICGYINNSDELIYPSLIDITPLKKVIREDYRGQVEGILIPGFSHVTKMTTNVRATFIPSQEWEKTPLTK